MDYSGIGRAIRKYRKRRHLTLEVASGLAGIDRAHLARIEQGKYIPQLDTFLKIAEALDVTPSDLMKKIEEELKKN